MSFLPPHLYVPWFLLGNVLPVRLLAFVIGAVHSANLLMLYGLGLVMLPIERRIHREAVALLLAIVAMCGGMSLGLLGTTFLDSVVTIGILASLLAVVASLPVLTAGTPTQAAWRAALAAVPAALAVTGQADRRHLRGRSRRRAAHGRRAVPPPPVGAHVVRHRRNADHRPVPRTLAAARLGGHRLAVLSGLRPPVRLSLRGRRLEPGSLCAARPSRGAVLPVRLRPRQHTRRRSPLRRLAHRRRLRARARGAGPAAVVARLRATSARRRPRRSPRHDGDRLCAVARDVRLLPLRGDARAAGAAGDRARHAGAAAGRANARAAGRRGHARPDGDDASGRLGAPALDQTAGRGFGAADLRPGDGDDSC